MSHSSMPAKDVMCQGTGAGCPQSGQSPPPALDSVLERWRSQPSDPYLVDLVALATQISAAPMAILTLSDGQQHWCQVQHEWGGEGDPYWSVATHSLEPIWLEAEQLVELPISGADRPAFYGGVPLCRASGERMGRLAVLSPVAIALSSAQKAGLQTLAQQIVHYLELQAYRHQSMTQTVETTRDATADSTLCPLSRRPVTGEFYQQLCTSTETADVDLCKVIENLDHGIVFCDRHHTLTLVNAAARQLLDLSQTGSALVDLTHTVTLYHPGQRHPLAVTDIPLWQALAGEAQQNRELVIVHPDECRYMVLVNSRPLFGANQQIVGAVMSLYDITQRYQTETDLRFRNQGLKTQALQRLEDLQAINQRLQTEIAQRYQAEATLRLFYELPFLGMAIIAADAKTWLSFNEHLCEMLGYHRDELQQMTWLELVHPDDLVQALQQFEQLAVGHLETNIFESRFIRKDSLLVYASLEIKVVPDADGNPDRFVTTIQDITERKLAETALIENETRFRATFEQAAVGIAHVTPDGLLMWLNLALSNILGYSCEELMGQSLFDLIHPADQAAEQRYISETLLGQRQSYNHQQRYICQDGSLVWAHLTVSLVQDQSQQPKYFIVVLQDITLAKQAETTLQQYAHRLQGLHDMDRVILTNFTSQEVAQSALLLLRQLLRYSQGLVVLFDRDTQQGEILVASQDSESGSTLSAASEMKSSSWIKTVPLSDCGLAEGSVSPEVKRIQNTASWIKTVPLSDCGLAEGSVSPEVKRIQNTAQMRSRPPILDRLTAAQPQAAMLIPLIESGQVVGEIILFSPQIGYFTAEHEEVAQEVADHLAIALQQARLFEQVKHDRARLHSLSSQLLEAQEAERRLLAHELHDEVGQALTAVKLNLHRLHRLTQTPKTQQPLQDSLHIVEGALQQIRNLSLDLRPSMLDDLGIVPALRWYISRHAERTGIQENFICDPDLRGLPASMETACFRIVQESLTNIARHAQAQTVTVELARHDQVLELIIQDDGSGFDLDLISRAKNEGTSLGLIGMEERAMLIGGCLMINSSPDCGTQIKLTVPLTDSVEFYPD